MEAPTTRMEKGQFIFRNDTEYDLARAFFNRKFDLYQAEIICTRSTKQGCPSCNSLCQVACSENRSSKRPP